MSESYIYDKAKYHDESVAQAGLPEEHASNHIVPMLRWLIENDLMSTFFTEEGKDELHLYREGKLTIHELFESWDACLISDMISEKGNAFAMHYFDYDKGAYIHDYKDTLQGSFPTEFHIPYSEENYLKLKGLIDLRYSKWQKESHRPWWKLW